MCAKQWGCNGDHTDVVSVVHELIYGLKSRDKTSFKCDRNYDRQPSDDLREYSWVLTVPSGVTHIYMMTQRVLRSQTREWNGKWIMRQRSRF